MAGGGPKVGETMMSYSAARFARVACCSVPPSPHRAARRQSRVRAGRRATDDADPNEIIVTAQFREQNLQDTPLAITAVNAETMEAKSQTNLAQVADSAPNVTLKPQGASFGPSISVSIRGIGAGDFNPAFEPGVGIYIDDVYYPQLTGAVFDLLDLDRVEILRGPQGTLSGRNSEGGSIKMFTTPSEGRTSGFVEGTYGSGQRIGLRAGRRLRADRQPVRPYLGRLQAPERLRRPARLRLRVPGRRPRHLHRQRRQHPAGQPGRRHSARPARRRRAASTGWARSATRRSAARCATTRPTRSIST